MTRGRLALLLLISVASAGGLTALALVAKQPAALGALLLTGAASAAAVRARALQDRQGRAQAERRAEAESERAGTLALHDAATGLHAEWYLHLRAHEELRRSGRYRFPLSVVSLWCPDEPQFRRLASTLRSRLRAGDLAAPFGNLHIVCLLPGTSAIGAMGMVAQALAESGVRAQVGIAQARDADDTLGDLLERAREGRTSFGPAAPRISLIRPPGGAQANSPG
jgi:PleD family two-component response regulator